MGEWSGVLGIIFFWNQGEGVTNLCRLGWKLMFKRFSIIHIVLFLSFVLLIVNPGTSGNVWR